MTDNYYLNDTGQILEIAEMQEGSDIFLSIKMIMFDTNVNLNNCQYTKEFLEEIAENKDGKYTCLPLVADTQMLESGQYSKLTHLQDKKTYEFKTVQIGSFYTFELNEADDGSTQLIGYARVPKRRNRVISALLTLHKKGKLKFSYEILVTKSEVTDGIKLIDVDEQNYIIGLAVVSIPACTSSSSLLVASLDNEFINEKDGIMEEKKIESAEELFHQCETYLTAELDSNQIRQKIFLQLSSFLRGKIPNWTINDGIYDCDIRYQFQDYVILYTWRTGDFYKISFTATDGDVTLTSCEKVTLEFIVVEVANFKNLKEEEQVTIDELTQKVAELEQAFSEKCAELATKNEQIISLGEDLQAAKTETEALLPYKEQVEKTELEKAEAEKTAQREQLKEKAAKVLDETEIAELAEAFENLDSGKINAKMAEKFIAMQETAAKKKIKEPLIATRITDDHKLEKSIFEKVR